MRWSSPHFEMMMVSLASSEEIAQMLASHRLYRETEYHFLPTIRRPRPWTGGDFGRGYRRYGGR
jgi:hypothetical protein